MKLSDIYENSELLEIGLKAIEAHLNNSPTQAS